MKPHRRRWFWVGQNKLRKRVKPNALVCSAPLYAKVAEDTEHQPASAEEFRHPDEPLLERSRSIGAIEALPFGAILLHFCSVHWSMALAACMLLDPVEHALDHMEPVRNLPGLTSAYPGAFGIAATTIAVDDLNPGCCVSLTAREVKKQLDSARDSSGFKMHEDGSSRGASSPGRLINTKDPQRSFTTFSLQPALEVPKHCIAARHDPKAGDRLSSRLPSSAMAHRREDISDGIGLMRARRGETWWRFGGDRAITGRRATSPFPGPESYHDRDASRRQVAERPVIPPVSLPGGRTAHGTPRHRATLRLDSPMIFGPADRAGDQGRMGRPGVPLRRGRHLARHRQSHRYPRDDCGIPFGAEKAASFVSAAAPSPSARAF
jgi:hypothetical protein